MHLELTISRDLAAFDGHFESTPIVPGVVQIQWVIEFANKYIAEITDMEVRCLEKLKFQHVIQPESLVNLQIELIAEKLIFSFTSNKQNYSSGKIVITK